MAEEQLPQLTLFAQQDPSQETGVLFPEIWKAAERLTSPQDRLREEGLKELKAVDVFRRSPLLAYVLATRLTDPNLEIRFHVIQALGDILGMGDRENSTPDLIRHHLQGYLSQMRRRQIFAILQVAERYTGSEEDIVAIFNMCSYAGKTLSGILADRKAPVPIRKNAIYYCGRVGYVDSRPALERLIGRLQAQSERQTHMDFVSTSRNTEEQKLILYARAALEKLKHLP